LAAPRADADRERHRARIRPAPPEGGDLGPAGPLEAGHDNDPACRELLADAFGLDARDAGATVEPVGADPRLRTREADRFGAALVEGHDEQRGADVLAGGEQQVELARVGPAANA